MEKLSSDGKHLLNTVNEHSSKTLPISTNNNLLLQSSDIHANGSIDIDQRKLSLNDTLFKHEEGKFFRKDDSTHEEGEFQQDTPTKFSLQSKNEEIVTQALEPINQLVDNCPMETSDTVKGAEKHDEMSTWQGSSI